MFIKRIQKDPKGVERSSTLSELGARLCQDMSMSPHPLKLKELQIVQAHLAAGTGKTCTQNRNEQAVSSMFLPHQPP